MLGQQSCRPVVADPAGLLQRHFGFIPIVCGELDSFNDRNFRIRRPGPDRGGGAAEFVLKVHNHLESAQRDAVEVGVTQTVLNHDVTKLGCSTSMQMHVTKTDTYFRVHGAFAI